MEFDYIVKINGLNIFVKMLKIFSMKNQNSKFYLVGGGIASLASAVFLIRDGKISGKNITIFETEKRLGGSLDAQKLNKGKVYFCRGFRMFEQKVYSSTLDLFSAIPSLQNPGKTIRAEFAEFNCKHKVNLKMRLLENSKVVDAKPLKMKLIDRINLLLILVRNENSLENLKIRNYFTPNFFQSNCWLEFATTFSFQPWDSLVEFKRYVLRFLQDSFQLDDPKCIRSTPLNQFDSIVLPIVRWLGERGVYFRTNCEVTDLNFIKIKNKKRVSRITFSERKELQNISVSENDFVLATIGSMIANSSRGSHCTAPRPITKKNIAWRLWEKLAKHDSSFGRPERFDRDIQKSKWTCFTLTVRGATFQNLLTQFAKKKSEREGIFTIRDSNWLLSIAMPHQPHFVDQPKNVAVFWGYGLSPDRVGNFVRKKMSDCSGSEILTELCRHLRLEKELLKILKNSICIPCLLPHITSQFSPRRKGDRPMVIPKKIQNFACIGQYCEIVEGIVFTVENSVLSAQIAVDELLHLRKKPTPIFHGQYHPKIIFRAIRTAFR